MKNINGHQLFLQFHGPATILLQTRASRVRDVLTSENIDEIADTKPGLTLSEGRSKVDSGIPKAVSPTITKAPCMSTVSIDTDGKVTFEPPGPKT